MWPNKNNHANFDIDKKNIIKKKYYLYKTYSTSTLLKNTKNYPIEQIINLKKFIRGDNSLFFKNFEEFRSKYLLYQKHEYLINEFNYKKLSSFFILKFNKDKLDSNYVILEHFGSQKIKSKHLYNLIKHQNKLIFLSDKKIIKPRFELLDFLNFKIGFLKKFTLNQKKIINKKEIFLGDTDIFFTTENTQKIK